MKVCGGFSYCLTMAIIFFGIGTRRMALIPDDFLSSTMTPWIVHDYFRPWRHMAALAKDLGSTIITVKTADGYVVVEAKHEEKEDEHGFVSRQFLRKYSLPEGAESENIVSELSSDGILTITAPRKVVDDRGERVVPITKTGPVRKEPSEKAAEQGSCMSNSEKCSG
uniref:Heat shock protein 22.8 n=1 Tax=Chilo suppressalis TaxID=168631 RepID=A0A220W0D0_CHISP|nr:heat shock protein 22.8 [Chilo suppressalis]